MYTFKQRAFSNCFTDANKIYFYSPQTSRREACKLSGGRAYGRCFAWIKYVCIRQECRLNIDHAGTTLYTTIFISRYDFRTWDKQGSRAYAAQHKGCRYNSATSKIVRRVLDPVLQATRQVYPFKVKTKSIDPDDCTYQPCFLYISRSIHYTFWFQTFTSFTFNINHSNFNDTTSNIVPVFYARYLYVENTSSYNQCARSPVIFFVKTLHLYLY